MGIWGLGLYQNDIALDIKSDFEEQYNAGKTVEEITETLLKNYKVNAYTSDERSFFWMALADLQYNYGMLMPSVRNNALYWIANDSSLFNYQSMDDAEKSQRGIVLNCLYQKLTSPSPPQKKVKTKKLYQCKWHIGDVFAYKLESDLSKEKGLYGRFLLIQKIDESIWHPGHTIPIVYVKVTDNDQIPQSIDEYNKAEYVQTWFTKFEDRFFPIDMSRPREDIAEKSKLNYAVDEYGYLPQYRIALLNTSANVIPPKLIFIGNFFHSARPLNEFIPHSKENITAIAWNQPDETFETQIIKRYCGHNLRQLAIYTKST